MDRFVANPTLKGEIKKARASGYSFIKAVGDICDGGLTMEGGSELNIDLLGDNNVVSSIEIKDDIQSGMYKLQNSGASHPLCWTHETDDHDDDKMISEFGTGLKSAAVCVSDKLDIITRYKDMTSGEYKYEMVICNWIKMKEINTFDPEYIPITKEFYNNKNMSQGTLFILDNLRKDFILKKDKAIEQINKYISQVYFKQIMNGKKIRVNGELIKASIPPINIQNYSWFIHKMEIILLQAKNNDLNIFLYKETSSERNVKWKQISYNEKEKKYKPNSITDKEFDKICSENTIIDKLYFCGTKTQGCMKTNNGGSVNILRQDRMLTFNSEEHFVYITFGPKFHMEQHYNYLLLNYNSKKINKLLGVSFTKSLDGNFPKNILTEGLNQVQRDISKLCKTNTTHNKDWVIKYGLEWDNKLDYQDNLNLAVFILKRAITIIQRRIRTYNERKLLKAKELKAKELEDAANKAKELQEQAEAEEEVEAQVEVEVEQVEVKEQLEEQVEVKEQLEEQAEVKEQLEEQAEAEPEEAQAEAEPEQEQVKEEEQVEVEAEEQVEVEAEEQVEVEAQEEEQAEAQVEAQVEAEEQVEVEAEEQVEVEAQEEEQAEEQVEAQVEQQQEEVEINPTVSYSSTYEQTKITKKQAIEILKGLEKPNDDNLIQIMELYEDIFNKYRYKLNNVNSDTKSKFDHKISKTSILYFKDSDKKKYVIGISKILIGFIENNLNEGGAILGGSIFYKIYELNRK